MAVRADTIEIDGTDATVRARLFFSAAIPRLAWLRAVLSGIESTSLRAQSTRIR
jgi:hypothetical protein